MRIDSLLGSTAKLPRDICYNMISIHSPIDIIRLYCIVTRINQFSFLILHFEHPLFGLADVWLQTLKSRIKLYLQPSQLVTFAFCSSVSPKYSPAEYSNRNFSLLKAISIDR